MSFLRRCDTKCKHVSPLVEDRLATPSYSPTCRHLFWKLTSALLLIMNATLDAASGIKSCVQDARKKELISRITDKSHNNTVTTYFHLGNECDTNQETSE